MEKQQELNLRLFILILNNIQYSVRQWFPFRDMNFFGSCEKIKNELGIEPRYSLSEGLKQTYNIIDKGKLLNLFNRLPIEEEIISKHCNFIRSCL